MQVHALRAVSLDAAIGDSVGIVGSNGSEKSPLLRAIAGIQPNSWGKVLCGARPTFLVSERC